MALDRLKKQIGVGRHASSIKRARQEKKRRRTNKARLSTMRTAVKSLRQEPTAEGLKKAMPLVMKAGQKGAIHKRKASRIVSRMARRVGAQGA